MLKFSRKVRSGDVVALRGDKYVRAGRTSRAMGVYQDAHTQTIQTDNGLIVSHVLRGVVRSGQCYTWLAVGGRVHPKS